jgi:cytoskeletal protein RodZ
VIASSPPPAPPDARSPAGEATTWTGEILRNVREARGISLQVIAERTKVMRHHLENIEAERFGALPAPVYLRGILLGLARELRLDGQKVARSYLERMATALSAPAAPVAKR